MPADAAVSRGGQCVGIGGELASGVLSPPCQLWPATPPLAVQARCTMLLKTTPKLNVCDNKMQTVPRALPGRQVPRPQGLPRQPGTQSSAAAWKRSVRTLTRSGCAPRGSARFHSMSGWVYEILRMR